jgi:2-C-methyl-D-erythritol 4-phosphate cytidylyltransferase
MYVLRLQLIDNCSIFKDNYEAESSRHKYRKEVLNPMNYAVVLAGGTGTRVGAGIPKQFIEIMGKPILIYTLENFQNDDEIDAIEVVCHKDWVDHVREICDKFGITKLRWLAVGGDTFQESVLNGVYNLRDEISPDDIAVISFGVSPFCSPDIINDSIRVAKEHGNGISAEDYVLCTCIKDDDYSSTQNLIRETIKGFSNPWSFRYGELVEAYDEVIAKGMLDDLEPHTTSVYFALGKRIWFSKTSALNFKISTRPDLDMFEGLLLLKEKRKAEGIEVDW